MAFHGASSPGGDAARLLPGTGIGDARRRRRVARPAQRHCGLQPHDAQRGVLCVVSRYRIYPDLPYRRMDFPRRAGRLVPAGLRLRGGAVASAAALRFAAGQTVYAVEGADETSPGRGFAAGALRPRRQRRVVAAPCGGVPAGLCDLPHGGRELPRRSLPSP